MSCHIHIGSHPGWHRRRLVTLFAAACLSATGSAQPSPTVRLPAPTLAQRYARFDRGSLPPETLLRHLTVVLQPASGPAALQRFVAEQHLPPALHDRQALTPEQFGARFGASASTLAAVAQWLADGGMTRIRPARGRLFVNFDGTAQQIESLLQTQLHLFQVDGVAHYANVDAPAIPSSLAAHIAAIAGLDDFGPQPQLVHRRAPQIAGGTAALNALGPDDLANLYAMAALYSSGVTGVGVSIAVLGRTPIAGGDFQAYRRQFGLPPASFQTVVVPDSGSGTGGADDQEEATADLEIAGAVAREASLLYVWGANVDAAAEWIIDNALAPVMSESYAGCENSSALLYQTLALQAGAEGITWISAAGDSGAAGCDPAGSALASGGLHAGMPASAPNITAVGGTQLASAPSPSDGSSSGVAQGYIPEIGWTSAQLVLAGGGGSSQVFALPGYQSDFQLAGASGRQLPDVSFAASPDVAPYAILFNGQQELVGGTSMSTPLFAGIVALVNAYLLNHGDIGSPGLGNINPVLYRLAEMDADVFHDTTVGTNDVPCEPGASGCAAGVLGYPAQPGFDLATGLGSLDANRLATSWTSATFQASSATLQASVSQIQAEQSVTCTARVSAQDVPVTGSPVQFYLTNPQYQSAQVLIATLDTDATGTAALTTRILPAGVNTIAALATGTTSTAAAALQAVQISVSAVPSSVAVQVPDGPYPPGQSISFQASIHLPADASFAAPSGSPYTSAGQLALFGGEGSLQAGPVTPDGNGRATLTSQPLQAGQNAFIVTYTGTSYIAPAQSSPLTLTASTISGGSNAPDFLLTGTNAVTLAVGANITIDLTLTPENGFNAPVQFACSGLSAPNACVVPAPITPAGAIQVPITLIAPSASSAGALLAALLLMVPLGVPPPRRGRSCQLAILFAGFFLACSLGCGSYTIRSNSAASAASYPVTITATSGTLVHTVQLTLTVTQ